MISCFFYQPALRRHLDDNQPLSSNAKAHLNTCRRCRKMVAAHRAIIGQLSAHRTEAVTPPPFLHARIVSSIEATTQPNRSARFRWAAAGATASVVVVGVILSLPKSAPQPAASWPDFGTKIAFNASIPENPLEKEIHNLRLDTLNAAKALAANFWPETDSVK